MSLYVTTCDRNAARPVLGANFQCKTVQGRAVDSVAGYWALTGFYARLLTQLTQPRNPAQPTITTPYPRHIFSSYPRSDRYPPPTTSFPTPLCDLPLVSRMFRVMISTYRRLFVHDAAKWHFASSIVFGRPVAAASSIL